MEHKLSFDKVVKEIDHRTWGEYGKVCRKLTSSEIRRPLPLLLRKLRIRHILNALLIHS